MFEFSWAHRTSMMTFQALDIAEIAEPSRDASN